jgi:hypothetical protein
MLSHPAYLQKPSVEKLFRAICILITLVYIANLFTPLRLHVDSIRYYLIKDCIESGCDPNSEAAKDYLPYGYTALLIVLSKLHILKSFSIVLINLIYLFGAVYFVHKIFASTVNRYVLLAIVLLNWTTIKFATHPLSEMQYLFFSMASLYFFSKFRVHRTAKNIILAFLFGGLAFTTRTIGITLFGALVTGVLWMYRNELLAIVKKNKILVLVMLLLVAGVAAFYKQLGLEHYTGVFSQKLSEGKTFSDILHYRFKEWAEIAMNVSSDKLIPMIPHGLGETFFAIAGIIILAAFFFVFFKNTALPFFVKAYFVYYTALMFTWPFYDNRFWVPLLPLAVAIILQVKLGERGTTRWLSNAYLAVYLLLGIAADAYYTSFIFDKEKFSKKQANGVYRNEYEIHYFGKPQSDTAHLIHQDVISILQRYD